jgi:hypothetical protein
MPSRRHNSRHRDLATDAFHQDADLVFGTETQASGLLGFADQDSTPVVALKPPAPSGMEELIMARRDRLAAYRRKRAGLMRLFLRCAKKEITSEQFYI